MDMPVTINKLVSKTGLVDFSEFGSAKIKALLFAASWCLTCETFTQTLIEFYNTVNAGQGQKQLEIILVSDDASEEDFHKCYQEMPWLAISYNEIKTLEYLQENFEITGIPALVIVDENLRVIRSEGCADVKKNYKKPQEVVKQWKKLILKKENSWRNTSKGHSEKKYKEEKRNHKRTCFSLF